LHSASRCPAGDKQPRRLVKTVIRCTHLAEQHCCGHVLLLLGSEAMNEGQEPPVVYAREGFACDGEVES
jgi:hypothetical protein